MSVCRENGLLLTVTETGYGRRSELTDYRIQSRGGKGLTNYHTEQFGDVAAIKVVDRRGRHHPDRLRRHYYPDQRGRGSPLPPSLKGVRVMRVEEGSRIVSLARAPHEEEEDTVGEEAAPDGEETGAVEEPGVTDETAADASASGEPDGGEA